MNTQLKDIAAICIMGAMALVGGFLGGYFFLPKENIVEATSYLPAPEVESNCEVWLVSETAPDYFWDSEDDSDSTSTADYWTVDDSDPVARGDTAVIPAKDPGPYGHGDVLITWWDSDRPDVPQALMVVGAAVKDVPKCS